MRTGQRACASLIVTALASVGAAEASRCPPELDQADRLIVVTTPTMADTNAHLEVYARAPDRGWRLAAPSRDVVVGTTGLGWAWTFADVAGPGEPEKREGDNRTPAGIFRIGRPFGVGASPLPGYFQLRPAGSFCVDDPSSPHYNRIVERNVAGSTTRGEDMSAIDLYRRGIVVDYPTSSEKQGGSCIFLHVWKGPGQGTSGCVAGDEQLIEQLQSWATARPTAIAILPANALRRFATCLPTSAHAPAPTR